jgi:hypothetical protein
VVDPAAAVGKELEDAASGIGGGRRRGSPGGGGGRRRRQRSYSCRAVVYTARKREWWGCSVGEYRLESKNVSKFQFAGHPNAGIRRR